MQNLTSIFTIIFCLSWASWAYAVPAGLQSGDMIFHTSESAQAEAIILASDSPFSHVGIIENAKDGIFVLEAISKRDEHCENPDGCGARTAFNSWISRGKGDKYEIYRRDGLDEKTRSAILQAAKSYLPRGYDFFFSDENREIYCSELVAKAFEDAGKKVGQKLEIGHYQQVSELPGIQRDFKRNHPAVQRLVGKRWSQHPRCKGKVSSLEACWPLILSDRLVTPGSQAKDTRVRRVFSNY